jgi:hypothetical protein
VNQGLYRLADEHLKEEHEKLLAVLRVEESALRLAARLLIEQGAVGPDEPGDVGEWTDWLIQQGAFEFAVASMPSVEQPPLWEAA